MAKLTDKNPIKTLKQTSQTEGERRFLTLVFADLSGFTSMSKSLDPEDVREAANLCFEHLNNAIVKQGGVIHKYEGDLVIALFGLPNAYENDPERAIKASLEMMNCVPEINKALGAKLRTKKSLGLHVGISNGTVFVSETGSPEKREYTVMGEIVNLGARLKDTAQNGEILVSETVFRLTRYLFDYEVLAPTKLKGIESPVKIFKILGLKEKPEPKRGIRGLYSPMVGREQEFKLLKDKVLALQKGTGGAVFILGDAGLGKSRLLEELKKTIMNYELGIMKDKSLITNHQLPITILEGRCLSYGETLAYHPFIQILRSIFGITDRDSTLDIQEKLLKFTTTLFPDEYKDIVPYIGYLFSVRFSDELDEKVKYLDPKSLKIQFFLSIRKLLTTLAKSAPHILVIEDYHWIDPESLELLEFIFDVSEISPLLFLGFSRIEKEAQSYRIKEGLKSKLGDKFLEIVLKPLDYGAASRITDNLLQISGITQEFKDKILGKTEGNPFYLEEIIRSLIDAHILAFEDGVWHMAIDISALEIPDTIQLLVSSRLDRLEPETKDLLQQASVIGRTFDVQLLEHLSRIDTLLLSLHLATLEEYEFIVRDSNSGTRHKFRHPLLHEVTYNGLLKKKRRELHREVAQSIEEIYSDKLEKFTEVLAFQYANSDDVDKAIEWLKKAGNKAKEHFANDEAISYFQQLISFIKNETEGKETDLCAAYDGLGDVYNLKGEIKKAIEYYTMMCYATKEGVIQARAKRKIALAVEEQTGCDEAIKMFDEAEKLITTDTPEAQLEKAEIRLWRCSYYRVKGETERALQECEKEIKALEKFDFDEKDKKRLKARGLSSMGLTSWRKCDYEKAIEYYKKSSAIYQELNYKRGLSINLNNLGLVYMDRGEYSQALELFEKDLKICEEIGHKHGISTSYNNMGDIYYYRGEYDKAIQFYMKDLKIVEEMGEKLSIGLANGYMGIVYKELGDWQKAQETTQKYFEMAEISGDKYDIAMANYFLGDLFLVMDELTKAEDYLLKAEELARQIGNKKIMMRTYLSLSELQIQKGEKIEQAQEYAQKAWELAEALGSKSGWAGCYFAFGKVFYISGAIQKAVESFKQSAELYQRIGRKKPLADVYFEYARMLKNLGGSPSVYADAGQLADSYFKKALEIYQTLKLDYKIKELEKFYEH